LALDRHAILPDHWVPLAVLGRTRRSPLGRVARLSGLAGIAHVLVSILLGGVIIAVGLQFRSAVQDAQDAIIGCILILTGLGFASTAKLTGMTATTRMRTTTATSSSWSRGADFAAWLR
jgi:hypothetical protein